MLRKRNVLLAQAGLASFTLVLHGAWLATVALAYQRGGAAEAGIVSVIVLAPAALLSPFVAAAFDRLPGRTALAASLATQAIPLLLAAGALEIDAHRAIT